MDEVIGHRPIVERLLRALETGELHHAYLFEGPQGVGRRLVARSLAQAANCTGEARPACGTCSNCKTIEAGQHPDVIQVEPDPARASRTIAVDRIREVVRQAGYRRYNARRRFVIVEPAEALLPSAANALLKTLEEPPDGTGFILLTSRPRALLPTILSRCQRVRFGPVPEHELAAWLARRGLTDPALPRLAQGCPGQALRLAESVEDRQASTDRLLQALGGAYGDIFELSKDLCQGSGRAAWAPRVEALLERIEDLLRDATVLGSGATLPLLDQDRRQVSAAWARVLWPDGIHRCTDAVFEARLNLAANVGGRVVVDALLARLRTELGPARRG